MARRVNTKFVILLGSGMFVVVAGILGVRYLHARQESDPVTLEQNAAAAEKRGELDVALFLYSRAAGELARTNKPRADELYLKAGDLAMTLSAAAKDPFKAGNYYDNATQMIKAALTTNPHNITAQRKLMDEQFKKASFYPTMGNWTAIDEAATKFIKIDPDYAKVYLYRATARLAIAKQGSITGGLDPARLAAVDEDVQKAMAMDPDPPQPVVLYVDLLQTRTNMARSASLPKEVAALHDLQLKTMRDYLAQHPNEPEVTNILSMTLWQDKQNDEAIKLLKDAIGQHPGNSLLMSELATQVMKKNPAEAEEILKNMIAANPNDPDCYEKLARYYQFVQRPADGIEALKQVLQHPSTGGGIAALQNIRRQTNSLYMISWSYMDIAEKEGINSAKGSEAYAQSINYANQLRTAQSARALLDLLDGRLHLLKNNLSDAIACLKRADDVFGVKDNSQAQEWRQVKWLLATAYEKKTEWGNELNYLEQFMTAHPGTIPIILQRANILINVARYSEALAAVDDIAHPKPDMEISPQMVISAKKIEARAQLGLGNRVAYSRLMQELGGVDGQLAGVVSMMAEGEMNKALDEINDVLKTAPNNERAYALAININLRMGDDGKKEAQRLLNAALEKFPKSTQFQFLKARINNPEGDSLETLVKAADIITDDYARNVYVAQLYLQAKNREQALTYLSSAMKVLESNTTDDMHDQMGRVCDQAFTLSLAVAQDCRDQAAAAADRAGKAANAAEKDKALQEKAKYDSESDKYWEQAKIYSQKAEGLNLDGAGGKLYQGRLLFAQQGDSRNTGLSIIEQTVASQPDNASAHTVLGQAYFDMNRPDKALAEFQTAIDQKPDNILALRFAIHLLIRKGDEQSMSRAQSYLQKALSFAPQDPMLKNFYDLVGNVGQAIAARELQRAAHPDDVDNIERLIRLYVKAKNTPKAIELLQPLYDKNVDNLEMADTLANYYREVQKYEEAYRIYEHFQASPDPVVRYEAAILNGDFYRSLGQYEQAIATFKSAMINEPAGRDDGIARLADLYFELDRMPDAEVLYQQIYDRKNKLDIRVARRLTEVLINEGKFDQATNMLAGIFKTSPQDLDGLNLRGYMLLKQHKSAEAIAVFNEVVTAHPENADALHYRALAQYTIQGDLDQAMQDLLAIRGKTPDLMLANRAGIVVQSRLLLARVYRLARKYPEAAAEYDDLAYNVQPNAPTIRVEYAQYLLSLVEVLLRITPDNRDDFATSIRIVKPDERLINLLQDSQKHLPGGQISWLIFEGNYLDMQTQKAVREKNPQAVALAREALLRYETAFRNSKESKEAASPYLSALLDAQKNQEVVNLANHLISDQPNYGDYYVKRGAAYSRLQDNTRALNDFHKAMELSAKDLATYLAVMRQAELCLQQDLVLKDLQSRVAGNKEDSYDAIAMAEMHLKANRGKEAVALLSPLVDRPELSAYKARILQMVAMGKYEMKDYEGASKDYQILLKITPDDLEALNNYAFMLADNMNQTQDAMIYAERAAKILRNGKIDVAFVNNGNVYDTYGWVKYLSGDTSGAVIELQKAVQIEPIPVAYLHLSKALLKDNRSNDARKALEDGIKAAKQNNDSTLPQLEAALKELH